MHFAVQYCFPFKIQFFNYTESLTVNRCFKIQINCNSSFGFSALWAKLVLIEVKFRPLLSSSLMGACEKNHGDDCASFSSEGHMADHSPCGEIRISVWIMVSGFWIFCQRIGGTPAETNLDETNFGLLRFKWRAYHCLDAYEFYCQWGIFSHCGVEFLPISLSLRRLEKIVNYRLLVARGFAQIKVMRMMWKRSIWNCHFGKLKEKMPKRSGRSDAINQASLRINKSSGGWQVWGG